jgi:hypothetical protein
MFCFGTYVIGQLNLDIVVTNDIAMRMLTDINDYYKKKKIIFISNREFGHSVDPKVYQLVNSKTIIGIAIVGKSQEQKVQATTEQSLYNGPFGYFNHIDSAIEWAKSFTIDSHTLSAG